MLLSLIQRLLAIVSLVLLAAGIYFAWSWWRLYEILQPPPGVAVDTQVWRLWIGVVLIAISVLGRTPMALLLGRPSAEAARLRRQPRQRLDSPSGARLSVETDGAADAPVLVFVHGWGMDAGFWMEARRKLAERFQVVAYDLAGLGRSKPPRDGRISLDRFADDLAAVVRQAGSRKVILVGHSIGGMTVLTFCRRYPEMLNHEVVGLVLENTTADNPARTTVLGEALYAARPVLKPLMWLDVWLQPLVWAMNWQSYLSGATHLAMRVAGFGSKPTREQLNRVALDATRNSPAIQAKGNLAMMDWRIEDELPQIRTPALVFIGGRDLVTVPQAGETIAWRLPKARPHRLSDAGHMGPLEFAEDYNSAIEAFADEVFTQGALPADAALGAGQSVFGVEPAPADEAPPRRPDEPRAFS
ncbi:MAG: alpha/beta hydrolase [Phenylobacterium sp.]|nr:alpha/beta hydrolase [Phenylobacterium sp.]